MQQSAWMVNRKKLEAKCPHIGKFKPVQEILKDPWWAIRRPKNIHYYIAKIFYRGGVKIELLNTGTSYGGIHPINPSIEDIELMLVIPEEATFEVIEVHSDEIYYSEILQDSNAFWIQKQKEFYLLMKQEFLKQITLLKEKMLEKKMKKEKIGKLKEIEINYLYDIFSCVRTTLPLWNPNKETFSEKTTYEVACKNNSDELQFLDENREKHVEDMFKDLLDYRGRK